MLKVVLDTDIFSEVLKGKNQSVVNQAIRYRASHNKLTISTITVMEIVKGFHKVQRETQLQRFLAGLAHVEVLTVDTHSAELAGRIYADLERIGQPIGLADVMIAAIAIQQNLPLVTGNTRHYQRIQAINDSFRIDNWRFDQ
ncbi:PIN domain-containing protein [Anaerolineales bacterium HSG24]|nr:PIN domain-containing protein [Anaerolineales bacterium HSG24]